MVFRVYAVSTDAFSTIPLLANPSRKLVASEEALN